MSEDFSRESTYLLTPNPKLATSLFPIDHTKSSLNVTPLIEPYFMNSPVSNSSTLNCVDEAIANNGEKNLFQNGFDQDEINLQDNCHSSIRTFTLQGDNMPYQKHTQIQNAPMIKQRSSCKVREQPFLSLNNGPIYLNDDDENPNTSKRGKSQSNVSEDLRGRAQTKFLSELPNNNQIMNKPDCIEEDSDDSFTDSDSSDSDSSQYQRANKYQNNCNPQQDFFLSPTQNFQQLNIQPDYQQFIANQQYQFSQNYNHQQYYNQTQQTQFYNIDNNFNGQYQYQNDESHQNTSKQGQQSSIIKKGIHKDSHHQKEKRKFKYGYKNMTREEYLEYRMEKAAKRDKKRQEKEKNAGQIETQMIFHLVLVEEKEKVQKKYVPKHIREQMEKEKIEEGSLANIKQEEVKQRTKILQKKNKENTYEIFQFSRNADRPLVRTVHKKELVIQFQVQTENPFATIEIGVFNYQDNIEFYFINKFKIINKFVNRKYNDNKYFETELTSEDFIFRNGQRFEFSVKYNCIILRNLDTKTEAILYCEKYIASNRKLNIFIRMFKSGDAIHLL